MLTLTFGKRIWKKMNDDQVLNGAAALAFYMILALFPALIFGVSLLPYLGIPHLEDAIMSGVRQALPPTAAAMIADTVTDVVSKRNGGLLSFGFLFAFWSASSGMVALMERLNVVHDVEEGRSFVRARLTAFLLTLTFFVLVVTTLGLVVFGGVLESFLGDHLAWSASLRVVFGLLRWMIIVGALHLALGIVYYVAPHRKQRFAVVTPGSVCATFGLLAASMAFKVYVMSFATYQAVYGSLGAVIVLLVWLFVVGCVILIGGELNSLWQSDLEPAGSAGAGTARAARTR